MNPNLRSLTGRTARLLLILITAPLTAFAAPGEPGTIDATWGGTGRVITPIGGNGAADPDLATIALQGDGRLVVGSGCRAGEANQTLVNPCLVRYLADGSLDSSFGNGGIVHQSWFPNAPDYLREVIVQPDQKLLLVGNCNQPCLARLNTDGSFDTSFGPDGTGIVTILSINPSVAPLTAAVHPDGAVSVAGRCADDRLCLLRVLPSGVLDGSWGSQGRAYLDISVGADVAIHAIGEADGAVTVAGSCNNRGCVVRLTPGGVLDTGFNGSGFRLDVCPALATEATRIRRQADGKYLVGATLVDNASFVSSVCVMRLNANGSIDSGFAAAGTYQANFSTISSSTLGDIAVQPDGRILIAAACSGPAAVCARRLNGDGSQDASFASVNGGTLYFTGGMANVSTATRLALLPNGNFNLVNSCDMPGTPYAQLCTFRFEGGPQSYRACALDFDGDGQLLSKTDALLLQRLAAGFKGSALTSGITFSAQAARNTAALIERYAVDHCGFRL